MRAGSRAGVGARARVLLAAVPSALAALLLALCATAARADTPVGLYQAFRGQVNFVGTEETLRTKSNKFPCRLVNSGNGVRATLSGIPNGAKVLSAQLYWAGSGSHPDYDVTFDGVRLSAPANRRYSSATIGAGYDYFSGAADVTSQVAAKGNGSYAFSGLSVDNGNPWCAAQGVVGGFALLVVYSAPSEAYRLLNLYEGFQYFRGSGFTLTLDHFAIPNPLPAASTGRLAHITWEGDGTLSGGGEDLLFNNYQMSDAMNPPGNQFNSASNVTGDASSYGIDFDAYTVSAPVIQPGQTSATTTYRSGQDMVLLSAEVAALPYVPVADLALSMTRGGTMQIGSPLSYTLNVSNGGADVESGPVTLVDTLPAGLKLVSVGGSGWSCASAAGSGGQTVVNCTHNGPVAAGAALPPVVLTATPTAGGNVTNSATVSGRTGDTNTANNTASDTASVGGVAAASFVFTTAACKAGQPIVASKTADSDCVQFAGPVMAADPKAAVYITSVSGGSAAALSTSAVSKLTLQLAVSCLPYSKVAFKYAGATLDCQGNYVQVALAFPANAPSASLDAAGASYPALGPFSYADVGQLTLRLLYNKVALAQDFVSLPTAVKLFKVVRSADNYPDLNDRTAPPDVAFAKAGEDFQIQLGASMANGAWAPSFGKENLRSSPVKLRLVGPSGKEALLGDPVTSAGHDDASGAGLLVTTLQWYEAGMLTLGVTYTDYLGYGPAFDLGTRRIGRFYPDHFTTDANPNFDCLAAMHCPLPDSAKPSYGVSGASYAGQPIHFAVKAHGLQRAGADTVLALYVPPQPVTITPVSLPNADAALSGAGFPQTSVQAALQADGSYGLNGLASYQLPNPYLNGKPSLGTWGAPQPVYLRASVRDTRYRQDRGTGGDVPEPFTITSQIVPTGALPTPPQQEDGLMLVNGRLFVGNLFGSELRRVPLALAAQYWTGSAWQINANDSDSVVATGHDAADKLALDTSKCTRSFASAGGCVAGLLPLLGVSAAPTDGAKGLQLDKGAGKLFLGSPARGLNGSIDIGVIEDAKANGDAATWLPSTTGRASFGLFKSSLIYLREVY